MIPPGWWGLAPTVIALFGLACSHGTTAPSGSGVRISGRLLDFRSQAGIAGAVLLFSRDQQLGNVTTTTLADGSYVVTVPAVGPFTISADGAYLGSAHVTGPAYPGGLLEDSGTCISRYGSVVDARTLRPVVGATVSLLDASAPTGIDGFYRIDLGCPSSGPIGFNTTFLSVSHPDYSPGSAVVGRGVAGVRRLDVDLEHR